MFLDHLGQSVVEGSVILDRRFGRIYLIMEMVNLDSDWVACCGFLLESEDMDDFDLCEKTHFCTARHGQVFRDCEVLYVA
jgi:hypothetical protein